VGAQNYSKDSHGRPSSAQKFIIVFPWIGTPFLQKFFKRQKSGSWSSCQQNLFHFYHGGRKV
jgi:hypothetical protein